MAKLKKVKWTYFLPLRNLFYAVMEVEAVKSRVRVGCKRCTSAKMYNTQQADEKLSFKLFQNKIKFTFAHTTLTDKNFKKIMCEQVLTFYTKLLEDIFAISIEIFLIPTLD